MINSKQQRVNMVESQVRTADVTDRRIIQAMLDVPREIFVSAGLQALAYMDEAVPLTRSANGRTGRELLAPRTFAKLIQLAEIEPEAAVLDFGCASGYSTAVLARLARLVVAVEVDASLAARASEALRGLHIDNAVVIAGELQAGAPTHAPFDAMVLEGAVVDVPHGLLEQLKDGGRLVAVVAEAGFGRAQVWRRAGKTFAARPAFDAGAGPLPGFSREPVFSL
jgi:protein-L-isoaspartate(D-aspartate) O-methyltransferase